MLAEINRGKRRLNFRYRSGDLGDRRYFLRCKGYFWLRRYFECRHYFRRRSFFMMKLLQGFEVQFFEIQG